MIQSTRALPWDRIDLPQDMVAASRNGKSQFQLMAEAIRLSRGPGKISLKEYMYYKLWRFDREQQQEYLGKKCWPGIYSKVADSRAVALFHDKIICYSLLETYGFPSPEIHTICDPLRSLGNRTCRTESELKDFLRGASYPLFAKPVSGMYSAGAFLLQGIDGDQLQLHNGVQSLDEFAQDKGGYLFQEALQPHSSLRNVVPRVSTLRIIVLLDEEPELLHCLWKIPAADNIADNFWRGNLLGYVSQGRVQRVVNSDRKEVSEHPNSGESLMLNLPDWQAAQNLALGCSAHFPMIRLQAYDIALTDDGPKVVEINVGGDFDLPQLAADRGFMSGRFKNFMASRT